VPNSLTGVISSYNAADFLGPSPSWISIDDKKKNGGSYIEILKLFNQYIIMSKILSLNPIFYPILFYLIGKREKEQRIKHTFPGSSNPVEFLVVDDPRSLQTEADWQRVVAVFALGQVGCTPST